jgi:tetratricopeptide (TPR) repeat protein
MFDVTLGGLLGFLFGIPKAAKLQNQSEGANNGKYRERYVENTNLEDISDWLTKIIIGVGLVELSKIPQLLNQYAKMIAPALGGIPSSEGFALAISTYYSVIGFFFVYLATRAYMESGLEYLKKKEIDKLSTQTEELKAELAGFLTKKGMTLDDQGKYDEAVQAYDKAIEIYPEYKEAWYNKGLTLEKRSQTTNTKDAKKDADDAIAAKARAIVLGYKDK